MTADEQQTMQAKLDRLNAQIDKMIALAGHISYVYIFGKWETVRVLSFDRNETTGAVVCICTCIDRVSTFRTPLIFIHTDPPTEEDAPDGYDRFAAADRDEDEYRRRRWKS